MFALVFVSGGVIQSVVMNESYDVLLKEANETYKDEFNGSEEDCMIWDDKGNVVFNMDAVEEVK